MARPPVGTVRQADSLTAIYSFISARLDGVPRGELDQYFAQTLGTAVRRNGAERAAARRRATRDWLLVDEARLGLRRLLIRMPGSGRREPELLAALGRLRGVRTILEGSHARDLYVVALCDSFEHEEALRSQVSEIASRAFWESLLSEDHRPAARTWRELSRRAAAAEGLQGRRGG